MVPVLRGAKLDTRPAHYSLCHTFCTLALACGLDPKAVSVTGEHSSVAFTQYRYQHVPPSMREATSARLCQVLFRKRAKW